MLTSHIQLHFVHFVMTAQAPSLRNGQSGVMNTWPEYRMECEPSIGRAGRVEEVAEAVAFLGNPLAGFINGANLRIDGGFFTPVN